MTYIAQASRVIAQHWRASLGILALGLWQAPGHAQSQLLAPTAATNVSAAAASEPPANPRATTLTGTLFNTREQRERLDRARQRGGVIEDNVETMVEAKPSVINGFVKRSDGRDTVWIDDLMKRNPQAEVVAALEPNMVGGQTRGIATAPASVVPHRANAVSRGLKIRKPVVKIRHKKHLRLPLGNFKK